MKKLQTIFEQLDYAKKIFEKWNLNTFIIAIGSLETFIHVLNKYDSIKEIPPDVEEKLLQILRISSIFDGELTEKIVKGRPFPAKSISIEKQPEIKENIIPNIVKNRWIRLCLVQLDFQITKKFPYRLKMKNKVRNKILKSLEVAKKEKVDIICFPELSFAKEFVDEVKQYKNIITIGGSFYDDNYFNVCPVIINGEEYPMRKIHPSPHFETEIILGKKMKKGTEIKIFRTEDGKFSFGVLICLDYVEESYKLCQYKRDGERCINLIFNPSYNPDPLRFQTLANSHCTNYHVDTLQTNIVKNRNKYGGTCIIGLEHKDNLKRLEEEGIKPTDDITYKLYEAEGEKMIIADLNLKGVEVSTTSDDTPRITIRAEFKYKNKCWQKVITQ
jgi:predicted amidohydrolase